MLYKIVTLVSPTPKILYTSGMKNALKQLIEESISALQSQGIVPNDLTPSIVIEHCRDPEHGDFATNLAMALAKPCGKNPRDLAQLIVSHLPNAPYIHQVDIAGPGFINFKLVKDALSQIIPSVLEKGDDFGQSNVGKDKRVHIEFVSANPTGPLHVGHGRGAAYGACVSNLLATAGFQVHREYYVNDAGRQMRILAVSVWLRYLEHHHVEIDFPNAGYQGDYIIAIAEALNTQYGTGFAHHKETILSKMPEGLNPIEDKEAIIDALTDIALALLGEENFNAIRELALETILADIKDDLEEFGVKYDDWFRESLLIKTGLLNEGVNLLKEHGHTYEKNGAVWFNATTLGDEKDRVLIRANGQPTYFASDVAYHLSKYNQGYDQIIDVFGADHHGYISRIRAFLQGLGKNPDKLTVLLVQFAILYRGTERVQMSTRSGSFVTLRELRYEVGNDAARYFYIMRKPEQHLDFDLELAKSQSNDNPVYYIQYAYARTCSVWRQLSEQNLSWDKTNGLKHLKLLDTDQEKNLMSHLSRYAETIEKSALKQEPHQVAHYLYECANYFHSYYNAHKFIVNDGNLRDARLCLMKATQQIIGNGLHILGLTKPEKM